MAYSLEISPEFERDYSKKCRKDRAFKNAVDKKIAQIKENPLHFKPLQAPMSGVRRAHVKASFVLLFEILKPQTVRLLALKHHDEAYE
ncbi:MAG: type II toxin-antitoxin system RelE/ParE family toxin [Candidatus Micrarchaeota archaeon]